MSGCRWLLLGLLACLTISGHFTAVASQENQDPNFDYYDFVNENEIDEEDLNNLAEAIAEKINNDEEEDVGPFARGKLGGSLKIGGGFKKGPKKVGGAVMTAGKKTVKVSGNGVKVIGKPSRKTAKTNGKELLKGGKKVGKGGSKTGKLAGKGTKNTGNKPKVAPRGTNKGQKSWDKLKEKTGGNKNVAAGKLLKSVAKEILEQGVSLAVEAVTPLIIEYLMEKTQESLCSCENTTCSCCAQPPGFEKACLIMRIRPNKKIVNGAITYNGEELAKLNITKEDGQSSCAKLSGIASFIQACISPIGIGEFEEGFRGCLDISLEPISLERTMCVDFTGTRQNGVANWVPIAELDEIEMEAEASDDE